MLVFLFDQDEPCIPKTASQAAASLRREHFFFMIGFSCLWIIYTTLSIKKGLPYSWRKTYNLNRTFRTPVAIIYYLLLYCYYCTSSYIIIVVVVVMGRLKKKNSSPFSRWLSSFNHRAPPRVVDWCKIVHHQFFKRHPSNPSLPWRYQTYSSTRASYWLHLTLHKPMLQLVWQQPKILYACAAVQTRLRIQFWVGAVWVIHLNRRSSSKASRNFWW